MRSKRLNIILQIFGFLVFSVGILYLCQFFSVKLNEGFLSDACPRITLNDGRMIYYCNNELQAETILSDTENNLPNSNDSVCISTTNFGSNYYTCYERPPAMIYNSEFGVYQPSDPIMDDDITPILLAPKIDATCAAYQANTIEVIKGIRSTMLIRDVLSNIITSTIIFANNLKNISTVKCAIGQTPPLNSAMLQVCSANATPDKITFVNTINYFNNLYTQKYNNKYSLSDILDTVTTSLANLSNLSTGTLYPAFNGMKCGTELNSKYIINMG